MTEKLKMILSFAMWILVSLWAITATESETLTQAINSIYMVLANG